MENNPTIENVPAALPAENTDDGGRLTDELLEEKLEEGKGPLPFVPGADGDKIEPPMPEPEGTEPR